MKNILIGCVMLFAVMTLSACQKATEKNMESGEMAKKEMVKEQKGGKMFSGSLKDIMDMSSPQKCSWTENGKTVGVVYVDGKRMRTEAVGEMMNTAGEEGAMLMINDGEWMYTWNEQTKEGMKIKNHVVEDVINNSEKMAVGHEEEEMMPETINNEINDYSCEKWKVDDKKFIPPSDVVFASMEEMMNNMKEKAMPMQ